ncbi:unnamed protein product [Merluccius merluccius]
MEENQPEELSESVVIRSLKRFRDRFWTPGRDSSPNPSLNPTEEDASLLDRLPVDVQFLILTLLPPEDICSLGATGRYWRSLVRDPLLWRYFLLRDAPRWPSVDHESMPTPGALAQDPVWGPEDDDLQPEERMEGEDRRRGPKHDYMAEYLKGHPARRRRRRPSPRPPYDAVASFLHSLLPAAAAAAEPCYAMFGPGIEQLDVCMVTRLMHAPDVLPVSAVHSGRQINGVGSGISYTYNNQHKLHILTLYSTNSAERDRARVGRFKVDDNLFTSEEADPSGGPVFRPNPLVQAVCHGVSGFIYVANAEPGKGDGEVEAAKIQAVLSPAWGAASRPLLVLSCVSRERPEEEEEEEEAEEAAAAVAGDAAASRGALTQARSSRTPSVEMAQRLRLLELPNPWMPVAPVGAGRQLSPLRGELYLRDGYSRASLQINDQVVKVEALLPPRSPWKECPEYIHSNKECFFDTNHTAIWTSCCVQLRSQDVTYFNEEDCFTVENIVRPDPPVAVNWTLLSVSPYGPHYDVIVHWEPPSSADVSMGWMRLDYELQYRDRNNTEWTTVEVQGGTEQTLYGLRIEDEYEVHIRCKMKAFTKFGPYSDSIFIQVTGIPAKETIFPVSLVLGILAIFILIMLVVFSQQQRLTVLLLPPVPTPKIKDIDPEMLKASLSKGKFQELNFILSGGGGGGGLPSCTPLFYQDEPLVDCIEVDADDDAAAAGAGERDGRDSDAQRLPGGQRTHWSHSLALGFGNHGDGDGVVAVAERFERDPPDLDALGLLLSTPTAAAATTTTTLLLPGQPELKAGFPGGDSNPNPSLGCDGAQRPQAWLNTDFYAQVSDVMPSGGVVLSPGQQLRALEATAAREEEEKTEGEEEEEEEEEVRMRGVQKGGSEGKDPRGDKEQQQQEFQLVVVAADPGGGGGYTSDVMSWQMGAAPPGTPANGYHTLPAEPAGTAPPPNANANAALAGDYQPPYILPDSSSPFLPPVSDYTIVQEVDCQHSLLLNPPPPPPQPPPPAHQCLRQQHPLKALAPVPVGYITPDLLGSITP